MSRGNGSAGPGEPAPHARAAKPGLGARTRQKGGKRPTAVARAPKDEAPAMAFFVLGAKRAHTQSLTAVVWGRP